MRAFGWVRACVRERAGEAGENNREAAAAVFCRFSQAGLHFSLYLDGGRQVSFSRPRG